MIDIRLMTDEDKPALRQAIDRDTFHPGEWTVEHFTQSNVVVQVLADSTGPIAFVRYTKTLRVSCVWNDGDDNHRNAKAIVFGIRDAVEKARASGYTEIVIQADSDKLGTFLVRVVGMTRSGNQCFLQV